MKKTYTVLLLIIFFIISKKALTQNTFPSSGAAGIGTTSPSSSSLLEIKSTTKGLLIPRLTQTQRNGIASPTTGLLVYQTDNYPGFYYYDGSAWSIIGYWKRNGTSTFFNTGNVGFGTLSPAYKIDVKGGDINLSSGNVLRINGARSFYDDAPNQNMFIGDNADTALNGGYNNTGVGPLSLTKNISGDYNTAVGANSMRSNTSGSSGVAVGEKALYLNTTGFYNTALGSGTLYSNTSGQKNTAVGYQSLYKNAASENVAVGYQSMYNNTTAADNVAVGLQALYNNTSGSANIAIGVNALHNSTTASNNTAVGYQSQYANTSGTQNSSLGWASLNTNTTGSANTAAGYAALENNTTGGLNTAVGVNALTHTNANDNSAVGVNALVNNTTGSQNTAIGSGALYDNTTGSDNTAIGYLAGIIPGSGISNATAIGANARVGQSNSIVLGGTGSSAVHVGIGTTSPQYALSVNGTIQAKEVRVETGWSDFVFDKNYKLKSLNEVQQYINQHHHLPEIPSASDIQKNGLAVADVQTKMMQKIEELTLYVIQLQKEIDQLKSNKNENR